jgi:hypothetical protein
MVDLHIERGRRPLDLARFKTIGCAHSGTYIVNQGGKQTGKLRERVRVDPVSVIVQRRNDIFICAIPVFIEQLGRCDNSRQQLRHTHGYVRCLYARKES